MLPVFKIIFWLLLMVLLLAAVVFVAYLVLLVREAIRSVKISNQMLGEVNKKVPRMVEDVSETVSAANSFTLDLTRKIKNATDFLGILGVLLGGIEGAKIKLGEGVAKRIIPSKRTISIFNAGFKRAIEVLFSSRGASSKP